MRKKILYAILAIVIVGIFLYSYQVYRLNWGSLAPENNTVSTNINANTSNIEDQPVTNSEDPLMLAFAQLSATGNLENCNNYNDCFSGLLTNEQINQAAINYEVVESVEFEEDVIFSLVKGADIDIPGIGTGYIENKDFIGAEDDQWYWEIGACSTNNRVFINAQTGQALPKHSYVYCSILEESPLDFELLDISPSGL